MLISQYLMLNAFEYIYLCTVQYSYEDLFALKTKHNNTSDSWARSSVWGHLHVHSLTFLTPALQLPELTHPYSQLGTRTCEGQQGNGAGPWWLWQVRGWCSHPSPSAGERCHQNSLFWPLSQPYGALWLQVSCSPAHQGAEELSALLISPCLAVGMRWGAGLELCGAGSRAGRHIQCLGLPGSDWRSSRKDEEEYLCQAGTSAQRWNHTPAAMPGECEGWYSTGVGIH